MAIVSKRINDSEKQNIPEHVACLESEDSRKRAYIAILAINSLLDYLKSMDINVKSVNNCHDNPLIMNEFDIADITLENNLKIDIRPVVGDKYKQIWIPKDHRAYSLSPDIYIGAAINKRLSRIEFTGFIEAREVDIACGNKNWFFIGTDSLRPMSDLVGAVKTIVPKRQIHPVLDHEKAKELFMMYRDRNISASSKRFLIRHLASCESCRSDFQNLYDFDRKIAACEKDSLLHYFNLEDYEKNLPGQEYFARKPINTGNSEDRTPDCTHSNIDETTGQKSGVFGKLVNILKNGYPLEIDADYLSSSETRTLETSGIDAALDLLYKPAEETRDNIIRELKKEMAVPGKRPKNSLRKRSKNYSRYFEKASKLEIVKTALQDFTPASGETSSDNRDYRVFRNLADRLMQQGERPKAAQQADRQQTLLKETLKNTGFYEIWSDLPQKQAISGITWTSENLKANSHVRKILDDIEDVEIINSRDAARQLGKDDSDYESAEPGMPESARKSFLIKAAAILATIGILTGAGLVIHEVHKHNAPRADNAGSSIPDNFMPERKIANLNPVPDTGNTAHSAEYLNQDNYYNSGFNTDEHLAVIKREDSPRISAYSALTAKRNMGDVLANAFINQGNAIKISRISWEVGLSLANNPVFKNYLFVTGQAIRMNLSRSLLAATDRVTNDEIRVQLVLDLKGNVLDSRIKSGSGSEQIDGIILQTLKATFDYTRLPEIEGKRKNITAGIIINL